MTCWMLKRAHCIPFFDALASLELDLASLSLVSNFKTFIPCLVTFPVNPASPPLVIVSVFKTFSKLLGVSDLTHFWTDLSSEIMF